MAKDADGRDLAVGDVVEHTMGPWPRDDGYAAWLSAALARRDKHLLSDGFPGRRTVTEIIGPCVQVNALDSRIPVYLGCYTRVVAQSA